MSSGKYQTTNGVAPDLGLHKDSSHRRKKDPSVVQSLAKKHASPKPFRQAGMQKSKLNEIDAGERAPTQIFNNALDSCEKRRRSASPEAKSQERSFVSSLHTNFSKCAKSVKRNPSLRRNNAEADHVLSKRHFTDREKPDDCALRRQNRLKKGVGNKGEQHSSSQASARNEVLRRTRFREFLDLVVLKFNKSGSDAALKLLKKYDLIDPTNGVAVASFLFFVPGLDKIEVGRFLGHHESFNILVLEKYIHLFQFEGVDMIAGLRLLFSKFQPPGESQQLFRIINAFAAAYSADNPAIGATPEQICFLAYAVLILHTDKHNSRVRRKMSRDDFVKLIPTTQFMSETQEGVKCLFDKGFLERVYDDVTASQFRLLVNETDLVYERLSKLPDLIDMCEPTDFKPSTSATLDNSLIPSSRMNSDLQKSSMRAIKSPLTPSKPSANDETYQILTTGATFLKYCRNGSIKFRFVFLSNVSGEPYFSLQLQQDGLWLCWCPVGSSASTRQGESPRRRFKVSEILDITLGFSWSATFNRFRIPANVQHRCCSVHTPYRTLDLCAPLAISPPLEVWAALILLKAQLVRKAQRDLAMSCKKRHHVGTLSSKERKSDEARLHKEKLKRWRSLSLSNVRDEYNRHRSHSPDLRQVAGRGERLVAHAASEVATLSGSQAPSNATATRRLRHIASTQISRQNRNVFGLFRLKDRLNTPNAQVQGEWCANSDKARSDRQVAERTFSAKGVHCSCRCTKFGSKYHTRASSRLSASGRVQRLIETDQFDTFSSTDYRPCPHIVSRGRMRSSRDLAREKLLLTDEEVCPDEGMQRRCASETLITKWENVRTDANDEDSRLRKLLRSQSLNAAVPLSAKSAEAAMGLSRSKCTSSSSPKSSLSPTPKSRCMKASKRSRKTRKACNQHDIYSDEGVQLETLWQTDILPFWSTHWSGNAFLHSRKHNSSSIPTFLYAIPLARPQTNASVHAIDEFVTFNHEKQCLSRPLEKEGISLMNSFKDEDSYGQVQFPSSSVLKIPNGFLNAPSTIFPTTTDGLKGSSVSNVSYQPTSFAARLDLIRSVWARDVEGFSQLMAGSVRIPCGSNMNDPKATRFLTDPAPSKASLTPFFQTRMGDGIQLAALPFEPSCFWDATLLQTQPASSTPVSKKAQPDSLNNAASYDSASISQGLCTTFPFHANARSYPGLVDKSPYLLTLWWAGLPIKLRPHLWKLALDGGLAGENIPLPSFLVWQREEAFFLDSKHDLQSKNARLSYYWPCNKLSEETESNRHVAMCTYEATHLHQGDLRSVFHFVDKMASDTSILLKGLCGWACRLKHTRRRWNGVPGSWAHHFESTSSRIKYEAPPEWNTPEGLYCPICCLLRLTHKEAVVKEGVASYIDVSSTIDNQFSQQQFSDKRSNKNKEESQWPPNLEHQNSSNNRYANKVNCSTNDHIDFGGRATEEPKSWRDANDGKKKYSLLTRKDFASVHFKHKSGTHPHPSTGQGCREPNQGIKVYGSRSSDNLIELCNTQTNLNIWRTFNRSEASRVSESTLDSPRTKSLLNELATPKNVIPSTILHPSEVKVNSIEKSRQGADMPTSLQGKLESLSTSNMYSTIKREVWKAQKDLPKDTLQMKLANSPPILEFHPSRIDNETDSHHSEVYKPKDVIFDSSAASDLQSVSCSKSSRSIRCGSAIICAVLTAAFGDCLQLSKSLTEVVSMVLVHFHDLCNASSFLYQFLSSSKYAIGDFLLSDTTRRRRRVFVRLQYFQSLFSHKLPTLFGHFKALELTPDFYLSGWLASLFVGVLPIPTAAAVWDRVLLGGEIFAFQVALGLLRYYELKLLGTSFQGCVKILNWSFLYNENTNDLWVEKWLLNDFEEERFWRCVESCSIDLKSYHEWISAADDLQSSADLLAAMHM